MLSTSTVCAADVTVQSNEHTADTPIQMRENTIETTDTTEKVSVLTTETTNKLNEYATAKLSVPTIVRLDDIIANRQKIIDWCVLHPSIDHVYEFKNSSIRNGSSINMIDMFDEPNSFIAGSYPLQQLVRYMSDLSTIPNDTDGSVVFDGDRVFFNASPNNIHEFNFKWSSNDIDLFLINKERPARSKLGPFFDVISSPEKSITELLIGFDLPVCRVALDFKMSYYVSIQAMYAILTRKMILPSYLKTKQTALQIMSKYCGSYKSDYTDGLPEFLIKRFYERVTKYSGRGFGVQWVDINEIIPWIKTRSLYAISSGNKGI